MAGRGHPRKDKIKEKSIGVRFSDEDYERFMAFIAKRKMTITQAVQEALELLYKSPE